jgi:hypothetical protein
MNSKQLINFPTLKASFQNMLASLLEGLKLFVAPLQINQLKQSFQSLIFKFLHMIFDRHFNTIMQNVQSDVTFFSYPLQVIAEGLQSTQSTPLLCAFECIECLHNYGCRMNNADFKKIIHELLSTQFQVVQIFKTIMKQNLRSLLRKEQSNREKKIHVILRIVGLYLNIEKEFYPICAYEVVLEFGAKLTGPAEAMSESQQKTYNSLLFLVSEIDWERKRIEPNIKEVVRKLPMLA